jgi:thiamine pyrophosphokinase
VCTADWKTSFDTQISTSNHVVAEQIEIKTDKPVVWTLELKSLP